RPVCASLSRASRPGKNCSKRSKSFPPRRPTCAPRPELSARDLPADGRAVTLVRPFSGRSTMPAPIATYRTKKSGLFSPRHVILDAEGKELGVLTVSRNKRGTIVGARYQPAQGEVLAIRRDPGILRSQFSCWTEGREWIGSSLRWSFFAREI